MAFTDHLWRLSLAPLFVILLAGCAQLTQETVTQGAAATGATTASEGETVTQTVEPPTLSVGAVAEGAAAADAKVEETAEEETKEEPDGLPSIESMVENMQAVEGFFTFSWQRIRRV